MNQNHDILMGALTLAVGVNSIIIGIVGYLTRHILDDIRARIVRLENNVMVPRGQ